jgi:glycosyltransferase involved in cell wall biosynthesis
MNWIPVFPMITSGSTGMTTKKITALEKQNMKNSLVSVIIPTRNSASTLENCLKSLKNQSYKNIEIIVVDRNSDDHTKEIAKKYVNQVLNKEPERSAQRNFGVANARGKYVLIPDSDMVLSENVVAECVEKMGEKGIAGVIIPEESFGTGFWAQCKKLERSFYLGLDWMEGARFFRKSDFIKVGGYNENMVSGEDWDLSQRIEGLGKIDRISALIYHNEGKINLLKTVKKKFYYADKFVKYTDNSRNQERVSEQTSILKRYKLFFSNPKKLFCNPLLGFGMLFMKTCEFFFGGMGYLKTKIVK